MQPLTAVEKRAGELCFQLRATKDRQQSKALLIELSQIAGIAPCQNVSAAEEEKLITEMKALLFADALPDLAALFDTWLHPSAASYLKRDIHKLKLYVIALHARIDLQAPFWCYLEQAPAMAAKLVEDLIYSSLPEETVTFTEQYGLFYLLYALAAHSDKKYRITIFTQKGIALLLLFLQPEMAYPNQIICLVLKTLQAFLDEPDLLWQQRFTAEIIFQGIHAAVEKLITCSFSEELAVLVSHILTSAGIKRFSITDAWLHILNTREADAESLEDSMALLTDGKFGEADATLVGLIEIIRANAFLLPFFTKRRAVKFFYALLVKCNSSMSLAYILRESDIVLQAALEWMAESIVSEDQQEQRLALWAYSSIRDYLDQFSMQQADFVRTELSKFAHVVRDHTAKLVLVLKNELNAKDDLIERLKILQLAKVMQPNLSLQAIFLVMAFQLREAECITFCRPRIDQLDYDRRCVSAMLIQAVIEVKTDVEMRANIVSVIKIKRLGEIIEDTAAARCQRVFAQFLLLKYLEDEVNRVGFGLNIEMVSQYLFRSLTLFGSTTHFKKLFLTTLHTLLLSNYTKVINSLSLAVLSALAFPKVQLEKAAEKSVCQQAQGVLHIFFSLLSGKEALLLGYMQSSSFIQILSCVQSQNSQQRSAALKVLVPLASYFCQAIAPDRAIDYSVKEKIKNRLRDGVLPVLRRFIAPPLEDEDKTNAEIVLKLAIGESEKAEIPLPDLKKNFRLRLGRGASLLGIPLRANKMGR